MGTISEKLVYLNGTKQAIKQAINEDFEVIDDNTTFREYADEISSNNAKYKDLIPKETTNATNTLDISNSSGLDKALVTQYGNTYQETTTGKNLFNKDTITSVYHGILNNDVISINTDDRGVTIYFSSISLPAGTYYLSADIKKADGSKSFVNINDGRNVYEIVEAPTLSSSYQRYMCKYTYTDTKNLNNMYISFTNTTGVCDIRNIMISNSSDITYEPYTNGASPNPDYPQEIVNISGKSTLKDVGKNLLSLTNLTPSTKSGITLTKNNDGTITLNGTASGDANFVFAIDNITATSDYKAQIYKQSGSFTNNYVSLYLSIDSAFSSFDLLSMTSSDMIQMSLGNKTYNYAQVKVNTGVVCNNLKIGIQIVNETTNTFEAYKGQTYEINIGNIELCKIGDYKDRIYYSSGKWYLEKNIGKVVLNGNEEWNSETAYTGYYRYTFSTLEALNTNNGLNNRFTQRISQAHGGYEYLFIQTNNGAIHIQLLQSRLSSSSIADFKTWLSNNNVTVYYVLTTPTTTEITESNYPTLYNQLNNIKLYEGVNHITMTNESGLDVEFDITYYKDWKLD
jgi:hypothetical protein